MKDALALALVHFIWQGTLLALAGAALMRLARVPTVRYAIGTATMLAMLLAPVMTFVAIRTAADTSRQVTLSQRTATSPDAAATHDGRTAASMSAAALALPQDAAPVIVPTTWILNVWAVGVMVLSLRFAGGWAVARRLAAGTLTPVGDELQALAAQMAARLNVRRAVRVCESASVAVPMMLGCLRPVIILPPAAVIALPLAQLEALLAHELAHIRRHDYLVNLLQTGVETLCFYHPAVWWISREVRRHREHCCDDIAVGVCDRLTYVTALSSLASISTPQLALSAAGGSLRDRVRRLVEPTTHSASSKGAWIAMLPILLVVSFVAPQAWGTQAATAAAAAPVIHVEEEAAAAAPVEQARPATTAREAVRQREVERAAAAVERTADARRREVSRDVDRALAARTQRGLETPEQARATVAERVRRRTELQREARSALFANELAELQNRLREQERTLARHKELVDRGLATRQMLEDAEAQLNQTRQQLERRRLELELAGPDLQLRKDQAELQHLADRELERLGLITTRPNLSGLDPDATLQPQDRLTITIDARRRASGGRRRARRWRRTLARSRRRATP
jgi:beta-lactamase regulating signal transducer with metallopeptidase domain